MAPGLRNHSAARPESGRIVREWRRPPAEVENCLLAHPAVDEVAVVGTSGRTGLVTACAFVVARSPSSDLGDELRAFARARLDHYKSPHEIVFLEALPRTHLGKVDRGALAKMRHNTR